MSGWRKPSPMSRQVEVALSLQISNSANSSHSVSRVPHGSTASSHEVYRLHHIHIAPCSFCLLPPVLFLLSFSSIFPFPHGVPRYNLKSSFLSQHSRWRRVLGTPGYPTATCGVGGCVTLSPDATTSHLDSSVCARMCAAYYPGYWGPTNLLMSAFDQETPNAKPNTCKFKCADLRNGS
jgi:hypothetical protein